MSWRKILDAIRKALGGGKPKPPVPAPQPPAPPPAPTPTPPPPPAPVPTPPAPGDVRAMLLVAHNALRTGAGLRPLVASPRLQVAAGGHAIAMARDGRMTHDGLPDGNLATRLRVVGYRFLWAGENIAMGYRDLASVMTSWMNSPGHRANILNPSYTEAGFAMSYDIRGIPFWCTVLGSPAIAARGAYAGQLPYAVGTPEVTGDGGMLASSVTIAANGS